MDDNAHNGLHAQQRMLSQILKQVRAARGMTAKSVAAKMAIPVRSYYSFEAGQGPLDLAKIWRFAEATDSDAAAIVFGLVLGIPRVALNSMDNKAASITLKFAKDVDTKFKDRAVHLGSAAFIEGFRRLMEDLQEYLLRRDESLERWLSDNIPKLLDPD